MSVQSEITRLRNAKTQIATAISNKGVTVPNGTSISGMAKLIENIPTGENLDSVIAQQQTLINTLSSVLDGKAAGDGTNLETCAVTVICVGVSEEFSDEELYFAYQDGSLNTVVVTKDDNWEITDVGSSWAPEFEAKITVNVLKNSIMAFAYLKYGRANNVEVLNPDFDPADPGYSSAFKILGDTTIYD